MCAALVRKGLLRGEAVWISDFPEAVHLESSTDDPQAPDIFVGLDGLVRVASRHAPA